MSFFANYSVICFLPLIRPDVGGGTTMYLLQAVCTGIVILLQLHLEHSGQMQATMALHAL